MWNLLIHPKGDCFDAQYVQNGLTPDCRREYGAHAQISAFTSPRTIDDADFTPSGC